MSSNIKVQRICNHCGIEFTAKTTTTKFCSSKCSSNGYKAKVRGLKVINCNNETKVRKSKPAEELKQKEFLTVRDLATLLSSSTRTVYNLIKLGRLQAVNLSERKILIKRSSIDELFDLPKIELVPKSKTDLPKAYEIEECYNMNEAAEKFGVSLKALATIIEREKIPKIKKWKYVYIPKELIEKVLT